MRSYYPSLLSMLAIVQFSSIAEDGRRGLPATRSLRTEQRFGKGMRPLRDRVRSTFQDRRRPTCGRRRTPWPPPSKRRERGSSLERRCSSRSFRYGYLVTTSPQSQVPPSTAASQKG